MNEESENYGGRQQNRVKFSRKKSEIDFKFCEFLFLPTACASGHLQKTFINEVERKFEESFPTKVNSQ